MSKRHERLLFRYSGALERGDFAAVADVLREAEHDPQLEQMILEMNAAYADDQPERFKHTHTQEVPMIATLYQKPTRPHVEWHSLALTAALAVIGLLSVLLALQTRSSSTLNGGQSDPLPALAQVTPLCTATASAALEVHTQPGATSVQVGTIPPGATIAVLDQQLAAGQQGDRWELWFFIASNGVQGWVLSDTITGSGCPQAHFVDVSPLVPTLVPLEAPLAQSTEAATSRQYMPVYVRPGDTLVSIFKRFNIDSSEIPELMRLNHLIDTSPVPGSAALPIGTILLLPLPNLGSVLTCVLQGQEQVEVLAEDSDAAPVVMTLQASGILEVFTEPIGDWYSAIVQQDGTTMSGVYVRIRDVERLAAGDCVAARAAASGDQAISSTVTPVPTPVQ